jgi:hypothetical protein
MVRVDRPTIGADVQLVAVPFLLFLSVIVAVLAQGLQLAEVEQMLIAFMRDDVSAILAGVVTLRARHIAQRGCSLSCALALRTHVERLYR